MIKQLPDIEQETEFHPYTKNKKVTPAGEHIYSYHFLTRDKKSRPWQCIASVWVAGDCCSSKAQEYFENHGYKQAYPLARLCDGREWIKLQTTQLMRKASF